MIQLSRNARTTRLQPERSRHQVHVESQVPEGIEETRVLFHARNISIRNGQPSEASEVRNPSTLHYQTRSASDQHDFARGLTRFPLTTKEHQNSAAHKPEVVDDLYLTQSIPELRQETLKGSMICCSVIFFGLSSGQRGPEARRGATPHEGIPVREPASDGGFGSADRRVARVVEDSC